MQHSLTIKITKAEICNQEYSDPLFVLLIANITRTENKTMIDIPCSGITRKAEQCVIFISGGKRVTLQSDAAAMNAASYVSK